MPLRVIFFDLGETLVDETRLWSSWADWLGVGRLTLMAALGATIARGEHHHRAFEIVRPGIDVARERARREAARLRDCFEPQDLYPDVLPCLAALRAAGFRTGVAGNQPTPDYADGLGLPVDIIASSAQWGVEKPDARFFARLAEAAQAAPAEIAYVGDRLDNDVLPAIDAGMTGVFIRRGPWGCVHALRSEVERAHLVIESLAELPARLVCAPDSRR